MSAPFAFRKKTPKKRRPREEPHEDPAPEPKKHKATEQESQKVPSRPPPRKPTDTPGPPPRAQRTVEKKRKEPKPIALPEIDALPKRGTTTSAQNLVLDIMVAHPPVAIAAFLKPHLREIADQVCKEVTSIPAIPRPPSSKDSSTNEAALTVLSQSERNLDSLIRRYEEERDQWEKAKEDILEKLAVNEKRAKKVNSIDNKEGSPSQDTPITPFHADQFASLIASATASIQQIESYCKDSSTRLTQHSDKLSRYNISSQVEQQDPKLLVQSIGSASRNS